jgi:hypothetical protein
MSDVMTDGTAEDPRWFDEIEETTNPWRYWYRMLRLPLRHGLLDDDIERKVDALCRAADERRLSGVIYSYGATWAEFRRHHEELEESWSYRRIRYLTWRAASLKTIVDYDDVFTDVDAKQASAKLAETMAEFGPYAPDGSYEHGHNFWRPEFNNVADGTQHLSALGEYGMMVLALTRSVARDDFIARRQKELAAGRDAGAGEGATRH